MGWSNPRSPGASWRSGSPAASARPLDPEAPISAAQAQARQQRRGASGRPARSRRTPSCTATATSASSTAPAAPTSWSWRRSGSGCTRWRSPTTTGSTARRCSPRPPRLHGGLQTIFGAELSLGLSKPQNGVADPEGSHLLVLARGVEGYHRLAGGDHRRPAARRREGPPGLRPRGARRARPRPLAGADRLPQGRGPAGARATAVPTAAARRAGPADRAVRARPRRGRADRPRLPDRQRRQRPARRAGRRARAAGGGDQQRPLRPPDEHRLAAAMAAVRARRSLAEMDGWLPAAGAACLRSGAEMARRFARYPGAVARTRRRWPTSSPSTCRRPRPRLPKQGIPDGHTPIDAGCGC